MPLPDDVLQLRAALFRECVAELYTERDVSDRALPAYTVANQVTDVLAARSIHRDDASVYAWIAASVGTHTAETLADAYLAATRGTV